MKNIKISKRLLSIILAALLVVSISSTAVYADGGDPVVNPDAKPSFITSTGGVYAHADAGSSSPQAWQKWTNYGGINADSNAKYLFLPAAANNSKVELYNNYTESITAGGVTIAAGSSAIVSYTDGASMTVRRGSTNYSLIIRKSDAEASVYVNDSTNSYVDANGVTQNTDLYSFLIQNKQNSCSTADVSVVSQSGISDTKLKKIKGRGNTNWTQTDKKPFNLNFNDMTTIGHTTSKKFSFVSNAKDSTLLRNSIMYDLASDVGNPYAPDTSFVDFFVNGDYRGCYIACNKVDLGKNAVVSLKDESDKLDTGFSFLIEVDVWNYKNDVYFETTRGYHVVLKTPDLDGYDPTDASMKAKYDYIKNTYQNFENVLYSGNMSELEQICDLDSLATMYLLQDFGKNCDGGYTSTYFTYNATEGKFYAAPIWDCDSDLGAVDCTRDGCSTSTCNVQGWTTRTATYNRTVNPYGKAFTTSGKTADGRTFEDIVKAVWTDRFLPAVDVLMGKSESNGRLKSIDAYADSISSARYNNYVMWDFMWYCAAYRGTGLSGSYSRDYSGELKYLKDWAQARANWITSQLSGTTPTNPTNPTQSTVPQASYYLTGLGFGGWGATDYPLTKASDGTYYIDVTLEAGTRYYFKIFDGGNNYYTANFDDPETASYVHAAGNHDNTEVTPTVDTKVRITLRGGAFYVTAQPSETTPTTPTEDTEPDIPEGKTVVYFKNTQNWGKVNFFVWYGSGTRVTVNADWPGEAAEYAGKSADGKEVYRVEFDSAFQNIIFCNDTSMGAQTVDIALAGSNVLYSADDSYTARQADGVHVHNVSTANYTDNPVIGDVDTNGKINIRDVTSIQLYLVGLKDYTAAQLTAADADKNGKPSIRDVTTIQLYLVDLIEL
ncbi:MAG: CotH kinase family protein [Ruminococcus sp.]|nr:CotH kinase family protein [Ruminococcus sp.]